MVIQVEGLSFRYNSTPVVRDITFTLDGGEILSILGPNGAGKTTLLKCLNRVLTPRDGIVLVGGKDVREMSRVEIAKKTGWVPQYGKASRMRVYDLILLGRRPHFRSGVTEKDHTLVEEVIQLLGLESLSLCYADEISGGELQLVRIARALAQDPRLILFDEPTSSLDISNQHRIMRSISSLIHSGPRAAVMTMHDINLSLRYADKFLLLKGGTICAAGGREIVSPEIIKNAYDMDVRIMDAGGFPVVVPV